jgi:hypothetical protein
MSDPRFHLAGGAVQLAKSGEPAPESSKVARSEEQEPESEREELYLATSPSGSKLQIPKELFVALSDFMKTRKYPGSITIQFRRGEIICVEAVAKKTYRKH